MKEIWSEVCPNSDIMEMIKKDRRNVNISQIWTKSLFYLFVFFIALGSFYLGTLVSRLVI